MDLVTPSTTPASSGTKSAAEAIAEMSQDEVTALVREAHPFVRNPSMLTHAGSFEEGSSGQAAVFRVGCWDNT